MNIDYYFPHWGPFVQKTKLAQPLVDQLLTRGRQLKGRVDLDHRDSLAGVLDQEYRFPGGPTKYATAQQVTEDLVLPTSENPLEWEALARKLKGKGEDVFETWFVPGFKPYVDFYIEKMEERLEMLFMSKPFTWDLESLWINFQQSSDFQPPHLHDGHLSFVIYLQFPEEIVEENKKSIGDRKNSGPGTINFMYGEILDFSKSVFALLPEEGDLLMFPSWLKHYVIPYKSDVERISVSGNLKFNLTKKESPSEVLGSLINDRV